MHVDFEETSIQGKKRPVKKSDQSGEALEELANAWAVRRAAGLQPDEEKELATWLEDPLHYAALAEAELGLSLISPQKNPCDVSKIRQMLAEMDARRAARRHVRRARALWSVAMAASIAFAFLVFRSVSTDHPVETRKAFIVRPLVQVLPDGSHVELNAEARISVDYTATSRTVRLLQGEAHFSVTKDPSRPFAVTVGPVEVRAVGTAFNVRYGMDTVEVLVTEGKVRVAGEAWAPEQQPELIPGQRTRIALGEMTPVAIPSLVSDAEMIRDLSWRQMRIEFSNATLEEAVALVNRRASSQLVIGDPQLKTLRITGIYWVDNPFHFADLAGEILNLAVERNAEGKIVLRGR